MLDLKLFSSPLPAMPRLVGSVAGIGGDRSTFTHHPLRPCTGSSDAEVERKVE